MSKKSLANSWHGIFGRPPVLEGEDVAAYDELCGRLYAAAKPADVVDEIYLDDVAPPRMGCVAPAPSEIQHHRNA
jgi:hypothetical protein